MNKKEELQKNKLDMQYATLSQKHNIYLTLITITIVGFVGTFVVQREYWFYWRFIWFDNSYYWLCQIQTHKGMKEILNKIDKI